MITRAKGINNRVRMSDSQSSDTALHGKDETFFGQVARHRERSPLYYRLDDAKTNRYTMLVRSFSLMPFVEGARILSVHQSMLFTWDLS